MVTLKLVAVDSTAPDSPIGYVKLSGEDELVSTYDFLTYISFIKKYKTANNIAILFVDIDGVSPLTACGAAAPRTGTAVVIRNSDPSSICRDSAVVISHEIGHTMGLDHDITEGNEIMIMRPGPLPGSLKEWISLQAMHYLARLGC